MKKLRLGSRQTDEERLQLGWAGSRGGGVVQVQENKITSKQKTQNRHI